MTFIETGSHGIPLLGFGSGTYYVKEEGAPEVNEVLVSMFVTAMKEGFVHLDSAECYGNDLELRQALKAVINDGTYKREDLFITDKYFSGGDGSYDSHSECANPYDRLQKFLKEVDTPYVDLFLLHAPFIKEETHGFDLKGAWKFMQQCKDEGLAKKIGVSNFEVKDLEELWGSTATNPEVNQIEYNAFLQDQTPGVVEWCRSHNVVMEAYSPLGPLYKADLTQGVGLQFKQLLDELSAKYFKSENQILLRWVIEQGIIPISTTSKAERLAELKGVFGWKMDKEDVLKIETLGKEYKPRLRQWWNPEFGKYNNI